MGNHTSAIENRQHESSGWDSFWYWLKILLKPVPKLLCLFDDIPFVLRQAVSIGPYLLVGAGFIIFPVQIGFSIHKLLKSRNKKDSPFYKTKKAANISTIFFASGGLLVTGGLLAFIQLSFPIFAAGCSIAIPSIMSIIGVVELAESISKLKITNRNPEELPDFKHKKAVTDATRGVIFNSVFLGLSLAITALAIVGVMSGLSVISVGIIPTMVLITVVVIAFVLKVCEIADKQHGKSTGDNNKVTNVIHRGWLRLTGQDKYLSQLNEERKARRAYPNLYSALNVDPSKKPDGDDPVDSESSEDTPTGTPTETPTESTTTTPTVDTVDAPDPFDPANPGIVPGKK